MNLSICKRICNECPFTKSSPKGWLGPHSLEDVLLTQAESKLFSCHMLRKTEMSQEDIESGEVRICRGYIASTTKSGLCFDDETEVGKALRKLQVTVALEAYEDQEIILSNYEFTQHHKKSAFSQLPIPEEALRQRMGYKV